jgi:hypothetical protein
MSKIFGAASSGIAGITRVNMNPWIQWRVWSFRSMAKFESMVMSFFKFLFVRLSK